jgi:hypothetical protein
MQERKRAQLVRSDMSELTRRLKEVLTPLSKAEERQAIKSAVAHMTAEIGSGDAFRYRVLGAELKIEKPSKRRGVPQRLIRTLIADYSNQRNMDISVTPEGKVIQSGILHGLQPAFHPDEIMAAKKIAERDQRMARLAKVTGSFASAFATDLSVEHGRRLVGLHYLSASKSGAVKPLATVIVDLYSNDIVHFRNDKAEGDG